MPEQIQATIVEVIDGKTVRIDAGQHVGVEVGMRFRVVDAKGAAVGALKIVEVMPDSSVARRFDPFVNAAVLSRDTRPGAAIGAGIGAVLGTIIAGDVIGGAVGAIIGGTFGRQVFPRTIAPTMKVVQVAPGEGLTLNQE